MLVTIFFSGKLDGLDGVVWMESKTASAIRQVISKGMTIGEVVQRFPETIEVMTAFGLHCAGCSVNYMETIEEGILGHGMGVEVLDKMIEAMNAAIEKSGALEAEGKIVSLSPAAAEKVKELMKKEAKHGFGLAIGLERGGCSGNNYAMWFEEKAKENHVVADENGVKVFIAEEHLPLLRGIRIDYVDSLQGAGFKIVNPNANRTCGCGQSFR